MFVIQCYEVTSVAEWFSQRNGKGLLIIFDGWDELSEQHRRKSLVADIICRKNLVNCSIIVTSCTYASDSLLKAFSVDRHVEDVGFSEDEVIKVIRETLSENQDQAQMLLQHFEIRGDALSLCYIPLICSIMISVCRNKDQFPVTPTELYQDFILQNIRKHVEINTELGIETWQINSLDDLPPVVDKPINELCKLAYDGLKEKSPRMTFTMHQLVSSGLQDTIKNKYFGLMTSTFTVDHNKSHQFLHLTIQEFLAAVHVDSKAQQRRKGLQEYYNDDHFQMCLRFVAGLTHLKNIYEQVHKTINCQVFENTYNKGSDTIIGVNNIQDNVVEEYENSFEQFDESHNETAYTACIKEPMTSFERHYNSSFYQNPLIVLYDTRLYNYKHDLSNFIFFIHLLYEAQEVSLYQKYT